MNEADRDPRWHHPWRDDAARAVPDDPADLGTAFGLDLSLQRAQEDGASAAAGSGGEPPVQPIVRP
jgi:hypothetical protein